VQYLFYRYSAKSDKTSAAGAIIATEKKKNLKIYINTFLFSFLLYFFIPYLLIYLFTETKASFTSLKWKGGIMKLTDGLQFCLYQMTPTMILSIFLVYAYTDIYTNPFLKYRTPMRQKLKLTLKPR
jgi:hypothetical protein